VPLVVADVGGEFRAEGRQGGVEGCGPQPDHVVVAAGGQGVPVGAERHTVCGARMAAQGPALRFRMRGVGEVPQPDGVVVAAGGQGVPVGAERHTVCGARMAAQGPALRFASSATVCWARDDGPVLWASDLPAWNSVSFV
jgi:hypothetical protein